MPSRNSPVAVAPNGQSLAYGLPPRPGQGAAIQLVNLASINNPGGKPQPAGTIPTPYKQSIRALAFSADSKILAASGDESPACACLGHQCQTASPADRAGRRQDRHPNAGVQPGGQPVVTGSADGTVRLYDLSKPQPPAPRVLHESNFPIVALAFLPGGRKLIVSALDRTLRLWNLAAKAPGKESVPFPGGPNLLVTRWPPPAIRQVRWSSAAVWTRPSAGGTWSPPCRIKSPAGSANRQARPWV